MKKRVCIACFLGVTIILLASCSKDSSTSSNLLAEIVFTADSPNAKDADQNEDNDYLVTRDMVEMLLQEDSESEGSSAAIIPYPSEDNPLLYVVNYANGWKIIPGDSRFGLVLAQSETGQMDLSSETKNPGFKMWLGEYLNQIESARGKQIRGEGFEESARAWLPYRVPKVGRANEKTGTALCNYYGPSGELMWVKIKYSLQKEVDTLTNVGPLLQTKWGQETPWDESMYSEYGSKCKTGCVSVAISQVLYYFHNQRNMPTGLYHTINIKDKTVFTRNYVSKYLLRLNRSDFTYNSPRWSCMPLTKEEDNSEGFQYVSDLMLDVGVRMETLYGTDLSSVPIEGYNHFDETACGLSGTWSHYTYHDAFPAVVNSLDSGSPVFVNAWDKDDHGHAWVIDGYVTVKEKRTRRYEWWPINMVPPGTAVFEYKTTSEMLTQFNYNIYQGMPVFEPDGEYRNTKLKMNWGYDGDGDGQYAMPGSPYENWDGFIKEVWVGYNLTPGELL